LVGDVEHSFQVEFAPALLEEVLQRLAEQIHDHNVVHLAVIGFLVANEVQERNEGLAPHLVDELGLPEKHNVSLHFNCFFLNSKRVSLKTSFKFQLTRLCHFNFKSILSFLL
jgi:hypothetical protein